jgi:hypothetical protein
MLAGADGDRIEVEAACGVSQTEKEEAPMSQEKLPDGWDEDKVRRVLTHYEEQTEPEAVEEDEAAVESSETVMSVPHDLVPVVREMIAKRQG